MTGEKSFTVQEVKEKLARYCAYQDRCHFEVEQKLRNFFLIDSARDEIILYLIEENFLNEERFTKNYVRGKFNQNHWGRIKIKVGLKQKKISENLIKIGLKEIDEREYLNKINALIEKRLQIEKKAKTLQLKQRVLRYLLQKGYEYILVKEQLKI